MHARLFNDDVSVTDDSTEYNTWIQGRQSVDGLRLWAFESNYDGLIQQGMSEKYT
jgi:hypothetical protein